MLKPLTELLIDDYATPEYQMQLFKKRVKEETKESYNKQKIPRELLLVERSKHVCHGTKTFVKTFKHLFNTLHPLLFSATDIFRFSIDNEVEANTKLDSY